MMLFLAAMLKIMAAMLTIMAATADRDGERRRSRRLCCSQTAIEKRRLVRSSTGEGGGENYGKVLTTFLRERYAMSGLCATRYAMSGTDIGCAGAVRSVRYWRREAEEEGVRSDGVPQSLLFKLRATRAIGLRMCYAMSGTDMRHRATRR
eukprot:1003747-Rhodomonas_salina.6